MTHPHPSDLPFIIPSGQGSAAIISRATGGIRWVKRPYVPAPWCPVPSKEWRQYAILIGDGYLHSVFAKWRPPQ